MVDHELARETLDLRLDFGQLAPIELDVGVPSQRMNLRHDLVHDVEAEHATVQSHDAHRANAGLSQALQLGAGRARLHHGDAFRVLAERFHGVQSDRVVVAIRVGLHHHHAAHAEPALQLLVHRHREVPGVWRAGRGARRAVVEMHVRVRGSRRRLKPHFFLLFFFGAAGFGTSSAVQKMPPWCASAMALSLGFSFARISCA
jgi:hypothetical protein